MLNDPSVIGDPQRSEADEGAERACSRWWTRTRSTRSASRPSADSLAMLEAESDEEMRELLKEELVRCQESAIERSWRSKLKILLLPKDPNDEKNVIVEIRAGAGGDEAALFAAELYRMYVHYAESQPLDASRPWTWKKSESAV